jgi:hypothetical protein
MFRFLPWLFFVLCLQNAVAAPKLIPLADSLAVGHCRSRAKSKGKAKGRSRGAKDHGEGRGEGKGRGTGTQQQEAGQGEEDHRKKSSHWCFTAFHFDDASEKALQDWIEVAPNLVRFIVVGHERCQTSGALHLQGYVQFKVQVRLSWLKKNPVRNTWHWTVKYARSSPEQAEKYCTKDNQFWKRGTMARDGGEEERDKWADAAVAIRQHNSWEDVLRDDGLARFISRSMTWAQAVFSSRKARKPFALNLDKPGFSWQGKVARFVLGTKADDRTIVWIMDAVGNKGKSKLRKFLTHNCKAMWVPMDMKSAASLYDGQKIAVVDVPREHEFKNYQALEQMKDAEMIQTKYEVCYKTGDQVPHILVFANVMPDMSSISQDRWHIIDLKDVTDDTSLQDLFPPAKFPQVKKVFKKGDPLDTHPNKDPEGSASESEVDIAPPPGVPIPLLDKEREPDTSPQDTRKNEAQEGADDFSLSQALSDIMVDEEDDEELSQNLRVPMEKIRLGLSHVGYPMCEKDIQAGHRQLAMAVFNYKSAGMVTLADVYDLYFLASGGGGSRPSGSASRKVRPHVSDPDNPSQYPATHKHKAN